MLWPGLSLLVIVNLITLEDFISNACTACYLSDNHSSNLYASLATLRHLFVN